MKKEFVFAFTLFVMFFFAGGVSAKLQVCSDGTFYGTCSITKPYFCDAETGKLAEKVSSCGCPETMRRQGESCISEYTTGPKTAALKYFIDGEEKQIEFVVYKGMYDYVSSLSRGIFYQQEEIPSRADFKLQQMNEENQREMLLPLVVKIQNITDDKTEQFRIAVSLVQSIPYGFSNKTTSFFGSELNYSRYPYEVIYDHEGICGEKSQLLAFLLRELGYNTALFYYREENHEAIGVRCPFSKGVSDTGYCFIETTARSIITDESIVYVDGITLESEPEIFLLSDGKSLPGNLPEYSDAYSMKRLRHGKFVFFRKFRLNLLRDKYGFDGEYNLR